MGKEWVNGYEFAPSLSEFQTALEGRPTIGKRLHSRKAFQGCHLMVRKMQERSKDCGDKSLPSMSLYPDLDLLVVGGLNMDKVSASFQLDGLLDLGGGGFGKGGLEGFRQHPVGLEFIIES